MPIDLDCPPKPLLQRFLLGELDDLSATQVDDLCRHVAGCSGCAAAITFLRADDSLVAVMRDPVMTQPEPLDDKVEKLIAKLCRSSVLTFSQRAAAAHLTAGTMAEDTEDVLGVLGPAEAPDEIGRLGPYRVHKVLGMGGMGVVFLALDPQLQRLVALKTLKPTMAASAGARRRFLREAQAIARITHDHIVIILHVGEEGGVPFLVMPLLPGETLQARLDRQGKLPANEVMRLGREVAAGLAAAHTKDLIHRDIKPSNIWLEGDQGQVRILDFGLARAVGGDAQLTDTGVVVGTPSYMAPEQARGEAVDPRTDLFSLGCLLYRACTGRLPFPGQNALATLLALAQSKPLPPAKLNRQLPSGLSELIMKLLAQRPEDRYPSAQAVVAALDEVVAGKAAPRRRRRTLAVVAGAVLLGIVAVAALWIVPGGGPGPEAHPEPSRAELFAPAVSYDAGLYPQSVAVADVNGDGKLDLVVANLHIHSISVLLGNGDGTFRPPLTSSVGENFAMSVAVADVNGDGKPDVIVLNTGVHELSVLLGKGDGTFAPPVNYGTGTNPGSVAVVDLNGDGKLDLAVANGDGNVSILLGNGDGTFREAVNYRAGAQCNAIIAADLDRDGHCDLAVASNDGRVSILLGNGDGTFRPAVYYTTNGSPRGIAVCDFNGDGKLDLATANNGGGADVLLGNGDGTFQKAAHYGGNTVYLAVLAADLNGDGWPDLALVNQSDNTLDVYLGNGDGTFQNAIPFAVGRDPIAVAVSDFNGDGAPDLVVANFASNSVSVLLHRPLPPYQAHLGPPAFYPVGTDPRAVVVGDLDRDGKDDLVIADHAGAVQVLRGKGDGTFEQALSHAVGKCPVALALGDFNHDGKLDLAVADELGDVVQVMLGKGDSTFAHAVPYAVGKKPVAVAVGDFDLDGKTDLVVANYDAGTVSVLRGKGDGSFLKAVNFPAGGHPRCIAVADVNGDGKLDLVVANRFQVGTVSVLLGKGDGTFAAPVPFPVGPFPIAVVLADFNGDGKLDLAVANWGCADFNVLLGNGDGTFQNAVNFATDPYAFAMAAADIDGDGKLDLVVTGTHYNVVCVLRGNGDGTFQKPQRFLGAGLYPTGLAVGHFAGGARPDVVTANAHSGNVSVLQNRPAAPHLVVGLDIKTVDPDGLTCTMWFDANTVANSSKNMNSVRTGTVHFSSSDPLAILPKDYTFTPEGNGGHTLPITFRTPGSQTVTISDTAGKLLPGSTSVWVFKSADLQFDVEVPKSLEAGKPFGVTVNIKDRFNGWTSGYAGTIRFQCTDPAAKLPANYTFNRVEQLHTFTSAVILPTPGEWTITAIDTAIPTLTASVTVTVRPAQGKSTSCALWPAMFSFPKFFFLCASC
jgi:hypothetical protein